MKCIVFHGAQLGFLCNELRRVYNDTGFYSAYFAMFGDGKSKEEVRSDLKALISAFSAQLVACDLITGFAALSVDSLDVSFAKKALRVLAVRVKDACGTTAKNKEFLNLVCLEALF